MWLLTFSLLIFLQIVRTRVETNFFKEFIAKFRNDEISPCDDFFRHICPRQMALEDSYYEFTKHMAKDWRTPGDGWVSEMLKDVVTNTFEMPSYVPKLANNSSPWDTVDYINRISNVEKLSSRAALLYALQNESHPMHDYSYDRLEKMHEKMTEMLLEELNFPENAPYAKELREQWERLFDKQRHVFGISHENVTDALNYLKFYGEFQTNYSDYLRNFDRPQFNSTRELETRFEELALIGWKLVDFVPAFGEKSPSVEQTEVFNAFNMDQTLILLTETIFSGIMKPDIPEAVFMAVAGAITGHEMYHTYVNRRYDNSSFPEFQKKMDCQIDHYEKSCILWREANCSSGRATWTEDGVDIEGVQLAWKLFKQQMGDKRKELLYPELNVTHEQMFFYGFPTTFCNYYRSTQHYYNWRTHKLDVHSGDVQRHNALFSLFKPFQEAFACQPQDKMVQRSQCNYFGEDVRR